MSGETRKRIQHIVETVEFSPSNLARSLKSQKSKLIGLVIADIENPFSASIIKGVTDTLHEATYNILVASTNNSFKKEKEYIRSFISQGVDGLIVNTSSWDNEWLISLANDGLPIVLADREVKNYDFDIVYIENKKSMKRAVEYVYQCGYRNIVLFSWEFNAFSPRFYRRESFIETMTDLGYGNAEDQVYVFDSASDEGIKETVEAIMKKSAGQKTIPVIITANEVLLLKAYNVAKELGICIPKELGLCGYDDWGWAPAMIWPSIISPRITTLTAQSHNIGEVASKLMIERLENPDTEKKTHCH